MLRVLVVSQHFWPEQFRLNQVVEDLLAAGAEVTVLTGHPNYPEGRVFDGYNAFSIVHESHPAGFEIFRVPLVPRGGGGALRLALNYLSFLASGIIIGPWLLRRHRFDVQFVYCTSPVIQGYVALWFKLLKRIPVVLWIQDMWPDALVATRHVHSPLLLSAVRRVVSWMYRGGDLIFGQSRSFVRTIRPLAGQVPVEYFPNPGEHAKEVVGSIPVLPAGFNIVFGGNLGRAQALETVLDAAELLRDDGDIHFTLYGSGAMASWLAESAEKRGLSNVRVPGRLPASVMPGVYRQASALLLTLANDEAVSQTIPSKLQSYLGAGRPVIAAVNGEAARIVTEAKAGIACPAEDPAALADAVRALKSSSPAERDEMGRAARRYFVQNYDPEKLGTELLARLRCVAFKGKS